MPQYTHREYTISISTVNLGPEIRIETEIFLAPDAAGRGGARLRASSVRHGAAGPVTIVLKRALNSAKVTADVLAARVPTPKQR